MGSAETRPLAVVTGASSGIGRELAARFAENGYDLTGCRISSRVGPLATGCRRASGGRGTTRPFGLMLLTFPNGRG